MVHATARTVNLRIAASARLVSGPPAIYARRSPGAGLAANYSRALGTGPLHADQDVGYRRVVLCRRRRSHTAPRAANTHASPLLILALLVGLIAAGLKAAGLPHFSPHDLRHTFASLLLQQGESPAYVQRQLGHASIKLTVDTYGKWLPMGKKSAVDALDDAGSSESGSKNGDGHRGRRRSARQYWWAVKDSNLGPAD
jgi:hypothetical protein